MSRAVGLSSLAAIAGPSIYLGAVSIAAVRSERSEKRTSLAAGTGDAPEDDSHAKFAVLIPAHDEEHVIAAAVRALVTQRYPRDLFDVHVVADNCTDATAAVARQAGACVYRREDREDPGKGPALNWLFAQIDGGDHDAVVIVDADTIADPGFLQALDVAFAAGADVVQGDYGVLEPERSAAVGLRYAALACRHRLRPLGRRALGCSCGLYGNGMGFRRSVLTSRGWTGHLVEDAQFQLDLLLDGVPVTYVPDARIAAEMPETLDASLTQHQRWELGRWQLIKRYLPLLAQRSVQPPRHALPRRVYLDAAFDQLVPPLSIVAALHLLGLVGNGSAHVLLRRRGSAVALLLTLASTVVLTLHVATGLRSAGAPPSVWRSLASAPRLVVWKVLLLARIARRPREVAWRRTERNSAAAAASPESGGLR